MTRAKKLANQLRQLTLVFIFGAMLAGVGYVFLIVQAFDVGDEGFVGAELVLSLVVQLIAIWVGLAWMGLVAEGVAEVLDPTVVSRTPE